MLEKGPPIIQKEERRFPADQNVESNHRSTNGSWVQSRVIKKNPGGKDKVAMKGSQKKLGQLPPCGGKASLIVRVISPMCIVRRGKRGRWLRVP